MSVSFRFSGISFAKFFEIAHLVPLLLERIWVGKWPCGEKREIDR